MSAETRRVSWKSRRLSSKTETPRSRLDIDVPLGRWVRVVVEEVCVEEEIELFELEDFVWRWEGLMRGIFSVSCLRLQVQQFLQGFGAWGV